MSEETNSVRESHIAKLNAIRAMDINPYPNIYKKKDQIADIHTAFAALPEETKGLEATGLKVVTAGRIMLLRMQGKAGFCNIKDDTGKIQIYLRKELIGDQNFELVKNFDFGDIIGVSGEIFRTRTGETTIKAEKVEMLSKIIQPMPEKYHGVQDVEVRYRQRYLDLIMNDESKEIFKKRTLIIRRIRELLNGKGFYEVETPMMQPVYGGAAARPFITHHNTLDQDLFLRIAPELYLKRLLVGGFERVYEINRNFRNEGISFKHNPEFTMMELYQTYADYNDMMDLVEEIVVEANKAVNPSLKIMHGETELDLTPPWKRVKLLDILLEKSGIDFKKVNDAEAAAEAKKLNIDVEAGLSKWKILDEVFKVKVEPFLIQPTIIYDYPKETSPLTKNRADDPEIVERFEPFMAGQEIGNAYSELNDPLEQRKRFLQQVEERQKGDDEAQVMDNDFLTALEYAMPPTGGLGVGIDRIVAILLNCHTIRDVILFPQLRTEK